MVLSRDAILAVNDHKFKVIPIPEWSGSVNIRTLTSAERDNLEAVFTSKEKNSLKDIRAKIAVMCVVDDSGKNLFTEQDIVELSKKSSAPMTTIFNAVMELNKFTNSDLEDLQGN